jgi:predicted methyltransferase
MPLRMRHLLALSLAALAACATAPATSPSPAAVSAEAIVAAPDRTDADRALDSGRKPAAFLTAIGVQPGMKVGELFAGGGYTTELLVRAVGPTGKVYAENPKWVIEKFAAKPWAERLARPINAGVIRVDQELEAPFPAEATGQLDLVVTNANYHDAVWSGVDRQKMNQAIFSALKPGGHYVIADTSARAGTGIQDVQTLHRIEESVVRTEVEAAGFTLEGSSEVLRNPEDTRDWNASPMAAGPKRGTGDRFLLKFVRP